MGSQIKRDGKRLVFRSNKTKWKWVLLWEPDEKCWACGYDGIVTSDINERFVLSCIHCGTTVQLTGKPGRMELDK